MNHCYLKIRAKGFTNYGIENLLARVYEDGVIMLFDNLGGCFTHGHNLSKNASKKLIRAFKIAQVNGLKMVLDPKNCLSADYVIDGWYARIEPQAGRAITDEEKGILDSMIYSRLDECMGRETIRFDIRSWLIKRGIRLSEYDFSNRFVEITNVY